MQRVAGSRTKSLSRSRAQSAPARRSNPCAGRGAAAAPGVATLAPAFAQSIPTLDGVPAEYAHEFNAETLYDLCSAFAREGLGTPAAWKLCRNKPLVFIEQAVMAAIGEDNWNLLKDNCDYSLEISDYSEREGYSTKRVLGRLALTISSCQCGYLQIGRAIESLEEEAEGLGAAFYWGLTNSLYRVLRLYNHDDALRYEEMMRESAEDAGEPCEFPEVKAALPACIRETIDQSRQEQSTDARRLLATHRNGRHAKWIERLRRIQRLCRLHIKSGREFLADGYYDDMPLPSLLVAFKQQDAIVACFDEESNSMLEAESEPIVAVSFAPIDPVEVKVALRTARRFFALNVELFQLVEELRQWEESHERTPKDRGDLPPQPERGADDLSGPGPELRHAA